ncbi:TasA family protein [Lysinibacter sp. HNR]|uniref:TasA family protein n=1 Tax=Lysinibacter sp. HNR TaxID=3031408 RepID=UPI0024360F23|nr:TasA family protein [Lysinibacter sp. HNR]WGD37848.1 TasA family protein [Lysinibacter sp. HNR]
MVSATRFGRSWRLLRSLMLVTGICGIAIVFGLSIAGETYAQLSSKISSKGPITIQAGTLTLAINDSSSVQLGDWQIGPSKPVAKAFKITNTGHVDTTINAQIQTGSKSPDLVNHANARITSVADANACKVGLVV